MSITITDPQLLELFARATESVDVIGPDGRVLGQFVGGKRYQLPPGVKSPFTDEQLAEFRKQRSGRPLADIVAELEKRYPS